MKKLLIISTLFTLVACGPDNTATTEPNLGSDANPQGENTTESKSEPNRLSNILSAQPNDIQQRYAYRNPEETLEFFGVEPGSAVLEVLPGQGWYSRILVPFIGAEGTLIGVDYSDNMWPKFSFATPEFLEERKKWPAKWQADAKVWGGENAASTNTYTLNTLPEDLNDSIDAVLFIRALHNLARFENEGEFLTQALQNTYRILKPGGTVGVVQHRAPDDKPDEWADGSRGYLKTAFVVKKMEEAGFELVAESEVNANSKDQPGEEDIVWRLPPSFYTSKGNEELQKQYAAIGESDRMTLKFRKPI